MGKDKSFQLVIFGQGNFFLLYAYYAFFSRFRYLNNILSFFDQTNRWHIYLFRFLQIVCWGSSDFITNDDLVTVNPEQVNRALQCQTTEAWWSHYLLDPLGLLRRWFTSVFPSLSFVVTGAVGVWHHLQRIEIQPRANVTAWHRLSLKALYDWACLHDIIVLHVNCLILVHSVGVFNLGKLIFHITESYIR